MILMLICLYFRQVFVANINLCYQYTLHFLISMAQYFKQYLGWYFFIKYLSSLQGRSRPNNPGILKHAVFVIKSLHVRHVSQAWWGVKKCQFTYSLVGNSLLNLFPTRLILIQRYMLTPSVSMPCELSLRPKILKPCRKARKGPAVCVQLLQRELKLKKCTFYTLGLIRLIHVS